ncbi:hypothetical protein HIM_05824 [Hirsutella minnesotensis 3608]|uniref:Non-hemolytic phospholipase C n=1 Tax=Hirsutella minnesotensis 3608 TaxID=1043627 RepID=A0A0F7ZZS0_9HYPO|nr:hypothetical protein HIM_05824 [Hirsutella minnesotensis 3608]
MRFTLSLCLTALAWAQAAQGQSLRDVKHIVLFMQENRAFDHYFGTMSGVRGFADPNVQINPDGRSVFEQPIFPPQNGVNILKPWHINYLGGDWSQITQCMGAGDNGWQRMHGVLNNGLANNWTFGDGGYSMGYFNRYDIPTHFDIAEGWTILDMSTQSVLAATDPNRVMWMSGSINIPGSPSNPDGRGGLIIDNSATPGCEAPGINCFPFVWKTFPEYLEQAGITWQVWQDLDNFEDNMLAYFQQYQLAPNGSALRVKGNSYPGLKAFYDHAAKGTLPQVSWIIGPQELAEHAPNMPVDGAWFQKTIVDAITNSPAYNETVLIVSYDEEGGWADHVVPDVPDPGTPGEYLNDPYGEFGIVPVGPGWRTARYIISPWTRGGYVFTEPADHTSDIMFVEQWAAASGYRGVYSRELTQWRRDRMSNLVSAFDFARPDYSKPRITGVREPERLPNERDTYSGNLNLGSLTGPWVGPARCLQNNRVPVPPIPWGPNNANQRLDQIVEQGFKKVRGTLTEGRYLTFEMNGRALSNNDGRFVDMSTAAYDHNDIRQRWIIYEVGDDKNQFFIQSALDKKFISGPPNIGSLTTNERRAQTFLIDYDPRTTMYSISRKQPYTTNRFVSLKNQRPITQNRFAVNWNGNAAVSDLFEVFSVSYHQ